MMLTEQHIQYLAYVSRFRPTVYAVSRHLGLRLSSVSMMRNRLRDEGLICGWNNYDDRIEISEAGKAVIADRQP